MPYEHTVTNPFGFGGKLFAIGQKIVDEAEAAAIHAKHLGRNLSRHEVTTPVPAPKKAAEAAPAPKTPDAPAKPASPSPAVPSAA